MRTLEILIVAGIASPDIGRRSGQPAFTHTLSLIHFGENIGPDKYSESIAIVRFEFGVAISTQTIRFCDDKITYPATEQIRIAAIAESHCQRCAENQASARTPAINTTTMSGDITLRNQKILKYVDRIPIPQTFIPPDFSMIFDNRAIGE